MVFFFLFLYREQQRLSYFLLSEEEIAYQYGGNHTSKVGKKSCWNGVASVFDVYCTEIDSEDKEEN